MSTSRITLSYLSLDVFTTTGFLGNPLAIVLLPSPHSSQVSQQQKQNIAREFNFSETVFIYDQEESPESGVTFPISIFTVSDELPFAGHPTIGAGWYLLSKTGLDKITLRVKAGDILVTKESDRVRLKVPSALKVHEPYYKKMLKEKQLALEDKDFVNGAADADAVVSSSIPNSPNDSPADSFGNVGIYREGHVFHHDGTVLRGSSRKAPALR